MGFRAYNSKGLDKNGAKCNMGFSGVRLKSAVGTLHEKNAELERGSIPK